MVPKVPGERGGELSQGSKAPRRTTMVPEIQAPRRGTQNSELGTWKPGKGGQQGLPELSRARESDRQVNR